MKLSYVLSLAALTGTAAVASATVLSSNTSAGGGSLPNYYVGQSVTTPSGGPWHNLQFNFYGDASATTPVADGTLWLFSSEYTGTIANVSTSSGGYLASTDSVANNVWQFDSSAWLQPNTQYFFYASSPLSTYYQGDTYSGGVFYAQGGLGAAWAAQPSMDETFKLQGTVPEPAAMGALVVSSLGLLARRRQKKA